jgi:DNA repair protein RadA/Sms
MKPKRTVFVCSACGGSTPKWMGRCPECGEWNTIAEEKVPARRASPAPSGSPAPLGTVEQNRGERRLTGIGELDRVLGGGIIPGQVALIGGDPGIGKSTLMLAAGAGLAGRTGGVLYISGEESPGQLKMRSDRLGLDVSRVDVFAQTDASAVSRTLAGYAAGGCIVDSIQVMHHPDLPGAPGTVSQVRESGAVLVQAAKEAAVPLFLIGHVTKGGVIAGPRTLEHLVDTVLYFEGEGGGVLRVLRSVKNRFGPTDEIGLFRMTGKGLEEVPDPGNLFLGSGDFHGPGGAVVGVREGRRILLVEIQALAAPARYGTPVRRVSGLDGGRVSMVCAVLERWGGVDLSGVDIHLNVTGGVRVSEPASDLGVAFAVATSHLGKTLPRGTMVLGEVGLRGEIRPVPALASRLAEAAKLGFEGAVVPRGGEEAAGAGLRIHRVGDIREALELADE